MVEDKWLSSDNIAKTLGVNRDTVRRWLRTGALKAVYVGGRTGYRIRESDLEAFLRARQNRDRE